jgi:hypothetical protein
MGVIRLILKTEKSYREQTWSAYDKGNQKKASKSKKTEILKKRKLSSSDLQVYSFN